MSQKHPTTLSVLSCCQFNVEGFSKCFNFGLSNKLIVAFPTKAPPGYLAKIKYANSTIFIKFSCYKNFEWGGYTGGVRLSCVKNRRTWAPPTDILAHLEGHWTLILQMLWIRLTMFHVTLGGKTKVLGQLPLPQLRTTPAIIYKTKVTSTTLKRHYYKPSKRPSRLRKMLLLLLLSVRRTE